MGTGYSDDCFAQIRLVVMLYADRAGKPGLSAQKQREVQAVAHAIEWVQEHYGENAREFIQIYCVERGVKLRAAADAVYYSPRMCQKIKRRFYQHIAMELEYLPPPGK